MKHVQICSFTNIITICKKYHTSVQLSLDFLKGKNESTRYTQKKKNVTYYKREYNSFLLVSSRIILSLFPYVCPIGIRKGETSVSNH